MLAAVTEFGTDHDLARDIATRLALLPKYQHHWKKFKWLSVMPAATETFYGFYYYDYPPDSNLDLFNSHQLGPRPWTVSDTADGDDSDGMTVAGSDVEITYGSITRAGQFWGFSQHTSFPIIQIGSQYFIFDDTTYPAMSVNGIPGGTYLYCFAQGTLIDVHNNSRAVKELQIGDLGRTASGTLAPVKWIGRQTVHKLFSGSHMQPVRIRAGALGDGLPHADLTVTADHGMIVDGLVINASALVNGDTIDWVPLAELPDQVTYYHIETENHDVILANGAASETFIDAAGRAAFDNHQDYLDLYGTERVVVEMGRPRITSWRLLPDAIRARLGILVPEVDWNTPLSA